MHKSHIVNMILLAVTVCAEVKSQTVINGIVSDAEDKQPIANILVKVVNPESPNRDIINYTETNKWGEYNLQFTTGLNYIEIEFSLLGYKRDTLHLKNETQTINRFLTVSPLELREVTVKAPAISSRGDTINYNVSSFISGADRTVEDILKKLPGITVQKNGEIVYQGEAINKFYIEGLDMLGGQYNLATQNISADQTATVQIFENHQPIRLLQDIDFSDKAAINIKLKVNKMSRPKGNIRTGTGYSDKWLYQGDVFGFMVNREFQMLFSTKTNNITSTIRSELTSHYGSNANTVKASTLIFPVSVKAPFPIGERSGYYWSTISSVNAIKKIDDYSNAKINLSYQQGKAENRRWVSSSYYTGDSEIRIEENTQAEIRDKSLIGSVNYQKNRDNLYINETFSGNLDVGDNDAYVYSLVNHHQRYRMKQFNLNNRLDLTWRRGYDTYAIRSFVTGGNIPGNRLIIHSSDSDGPVEQTVSGHSVYTRHSTAFVKQLNANSNLSIDLSFESEHDKIFTDLVNMSLNEYNTNRNRGYKLTSSALLVYTYSKNRFRLSLSSPVRYYHFNYKSDSDFRLDKPVIAPNIRAKYQFTPAFKVNISSGIDHTFGNILNFIEEPVQKSYLNFSEGEPGILAQNKRMRVNIGYDYRNTMDGLFSSMLLGYNKTERNILSGSVISESGTITAFSEGTKNFSNNITSNLYLAKNFHDIHTVASISVNTLYSENERQRHDVRVKYFNHVLLIVPTVNFNLIDWLAFRTSGSFDFTRQKINTAIQSLTNRINNWGTDMELSVLPFQNMEIYYNLNYSNRPLQENRRENIFFMDCGIRFQPSREIELELSLWNLANQKSYTRAIYRELDRIETTHFLRPLGCLFTIKINY